MTMISSSPLQIFFLLLLLGLPLTTHSAVYHAQYHIARRHTQCLYSDFKSGETATFELFILNSPTNGRLSAGVQIEGPIATDKIGEKVTVKEGEEDKGERTSKRARPSDTYDPHRFANLDSDDDNPYSIGTLLQDAIENWPRYVSQNKASFQQNGIIHHFFHIDYTHSGENEDAVRARAEITREIQRDEEHRRRLIEERRREQREQQRERGGPPPPNDEIYEDTGRLERILPDEIAPYEWSKRIKSSGWYRLCVQADDDILVQMDIRNSAIFGGVNYDTGHVYTFADWEEWEEEQRINKVNELREKAKADEEARATMEQLNAALKDQVKDFDLEATQRLMSEVNSLVSQMQQKQSAVHQRIKSHEGIAKRNYQKIRKSGIFETIMYLLITGYQVYTVHNWLLSNNSLGR